MTLLLVVLVLVGCNDQKPAAPNAAPSATMNAPPPPPPPPPAAPAAAAALGAPAADAATNSTTAGAAAASTAPAQPEGRREKAEFGVGAKGHDYGPGLITTPMSIYFTAGERVTFSIKIPKAMQLFQATENRFPKSHEEFMEKIIKDNDIVLPNLPPGCRYEYDPKLGELMVVHPAK